MREDDAARLAVRPANPMDEAMVDMLADRMADFPVPPWRTRGEIADGFHPMLRDAVHRRGDEQALLVAEHEEDGALGGVLVTTEYDEWNGRAQARVVVLAVSHGAEGRGVAGRLLEAAEAWAREQGLRTLVCQAFESNWRALAFCEHEGFRRDTVRFVKAL